MKTNVTVDDELMQRVLKTRKFKTKKDAVEFGLKLIFQLEEQSVIRKYRGKLKWTGSLLRHDRTNASSQNKSETSVDR